MARRPQNIRRALPWLFALALVALVGNHLHEALKFSDADLIAYADSLRVGNQDENQDRDPISALRVLDQLLEREPEHFAGLLSAARAWGDLRNYTKAVELLDAAAESVESVGQKCNAKRLAVNYLISDARYDEAVAVAQEVVDLQPTNALPPLQLGAALYRGSVATQDDVLLRFAKKEKSLAELEIEERVEAYVTDMWGQPDLQRLVDFLAIEGDSDFRQALTADLAAARQRFLDASTAMQDYRNYAGFDMQVAQAYTEMLRRSGRVFEAHVESAIVLRRPDLPISNRRVLLETMASCALILGEHAQAADAYEQIVSGYEEEQGWAPPRYPAALIEQRVLDRDWPWVERNLRRMDRLVRDDVWWSYAKARWHMAGGRLDEATRQVDDYYPIVSLGSVMPYSIRGVPSRRREMLMLAHLVYSAQDSPSAIAALDALLLSYPDDLEARRLRATIQREQGYLDGAMEDAFRLLRRDRRDLGDFELWLSIADELSVTRHGATLAERAVERVQDEDSLRRASLKAAFDSSQVRQRRGGSALTGSTGASFPSQDAALAFETIRERVRHNDNERARNDARQLVQTYPQVQEFRYRLARLLVREGRHESAVKDFREILESVPGDTETLDLAMRVEMVLGHHAEAAAFVNSMILADPLGVGAVRYAQLLLDDGQAMRCERLIERLAELWDEDPGLDVLTMAARAQLAQGKFETATAVLQSLHASYPLSEDVALLGLELGLAQEHEGLIDAAVEALGPLSAGLFPDQVARLAQELLASARYEELLAIFPHRQRDLPALLPALRPLAEANKALGDVDETDRLLGLLDDERSLRDRFLLLAMAGRSADATRRLRLSPTRSDQRSELDLCLALGAVLDDDAALIDDVPTSRLRTLGLDQELDPVQLELLDATMRLLPSVRRPEKMIPAGIADAPGEAYPHAGPQVERLIALARDDPQRAESACQSLVLMLVAGESPFWRRETRALAEHVLGVLPGLEAPNLLLARRRVEQDLAKEALQLLRQVVSAETPDVRAVELFLQASRQFGREEWGVALGLILSERDDAYRLVLADALAESGRPAEALPFYEQLLSSTPDDRDALAGTLRATALLNLDASSADTARQVMDTHPGDLELLRVCSESLAAIRTPDPGIIEVMQRLSDMLPDDVRLLEALARAWSGDPEQVERYLAAMLSAIEAQPVSQASPEARPRTLLLMGASNTARRTGLSDRARQLTEVALQLQPGNVMLYRELAFLELEEGNLDIARRYLEVLSFVNRGDKGPPLALAQLLFEQVGQPHLAADVIRRAYQYSMPPLAVEILGAEAYLRGRVNDAISSFHSLRNNPLVTPETVLNLARMAFAAGLDEPAAKTLDVFLTTASKEHPARPRAEALRKACSVIDAPPSAAVAQD